MLIILSVINKYFEPSITHTLIMIISGMIVYFLMVAILRDELLIENASKILQKLRRNNNASS